MDLVSIIIPVYNEEDTIYEVINEITKLNNKINIEIIIINDGSKDNTNDVIEKFLHVDNLLYINYKKNLGKGAAIRTGIMKSSGDIIIIQDADMEYFPKDIPKLIKPILDGKADVVYGSRFLGNIEGMSHIHNMGNKILSFLTQILLRESITDVMTGYKAFKADIIKQLELTQTGFEIEIEITVKLLKRQVRIKEVPIAYRYRDKGISKITYLDGFRSLYKLVYFFVHAD